MKNQPRTIRFRGHDEPILDKFLVRGREYLVLEQLSRRGAFRVFDRRAGIHGDYRVLYRLPYSRITGQQIETLRRMSGPMANRNFPYISDCTRQGADLFIVMSWVWGTNLRQLLQDVRRGEISRPSVTETVRLIRGLAHGISHYHRKTQVVHGDISPANIIVTTGTKNLVLIDFGSAWPVEMSATKQLGDGISPPYAAPERIGRHALEDFRSDMFSLSAIAYELLTLEIPFDGAGGRAGLPRVADEFSQSYIPPTRLISQANRLPQLALPLLDDLFRVSLSFHPDQRFATRGEWLAAWDNLHTALQKGRRLSSLEQRLTDWMEALMKIFRLTNRR